MQPQCKVLKGVACSIHESADKPEVATTYCNHCLHAHHTATANTHRHLECSADSMSDATAASSPTVASRPTAPASPPCRLLPLLRPPPAAVRLHQPPCAGSAPLTAQHLGCQSLTAAQPVVRGKGWGVARAWGGGRLKGVSAHNDTDDLVVSSRHIRETVKTSTHHAHNHETLCSSVLLDQSLARYTPESRVVFPSPPPPQCHLSAPPFPVHLCACCNDECCAPADDLP